MFNYRQWVSYELQNYIASDELNYACKNDDHQCVQLCSLPSVRRYQIWGSPHSPQQERSISYNITETQVSKRDIGSFLLRNTSSFSTAQYTPSTLQKKEVE